MHQGASLEKGLVAGEEAHAGEGGEDDYGQVYDDVDVGEDPQVDEEAMQDQAEAPEDYADDEDLYNDIVPGIGQVDGVSMQLLLLYEASRALCQDPNHLLTGTGYKRPLLVLSPAYLCIPVQKYRKLPAMHAIWW